MDNSPPQFIYKIVPGTPALPMKTNGKLSPDFVLPVSDLDRSSNFIHMSTAPQVANTLKHFFVSPQTSRNSVYLLRVPYQPFEERSLVRWESPDAKVCGPRNGEGMFPHIHRPSDLTLKAHEVESAKEVVSDVGEDDWEKSLSVLSEDAWLV